MSNQTPPEPWNSFLADIDSLLKDHVQLHCLGGFVATQMYGLARATVDIDFVGVIPVQLWTRLSGIAGKGSDLHKSHGIYLDPVTVATLPDNYESRLIPMFSGRWFRLQLFALEAHDLALAKLERNYERDFSDVLVLARNGHLKIDILKERYFAELRPNLLSRISYQDQTLGLWLDSIAQS